VVATAQEQVLQGILPKVIINKITISNSLENNKLIINLNLIIKETLDNDQFGTWFNQNVIIKYVKVDVFQSTNKDATSILSYSNNMIKTLGTNQFNSLLTDNSLIASGFISSGASFISRETERNRIRNILSSNVTIKTISLRNNSQLNSFSSYPDNDGNLIYEVPYQISYELTQTNPEHLSYFAVSRIDLEKLSQDFNIDYDIAESLEENGKVTSEIVIDSFRVVDTSNIYVDENGQTWDGPVHLSPQNIWRTGDEEGPASANLTLTSVANNKVQDFRNISEIERKIVDFSSLFLSASNITDITKIQSTNFKLSGNDNIFSDLFLSRDYDGVLKFIFGIDFNKALKHFSSLGHLYNTKNSDFKEAAINKSRILKLNIKRRRIENQIDKKISQIKEIQNSNNNYDNEISIISSRDRLSWKDFITISSENGRNFIGEVNLATKEMVSRSIRYFTATDQLFTLQQKINFEGSYQYGVELEVEDGTIKLITDILNILNNSKNSLTRYYNLVSKPTMKKYFLENDNPHLNTLNSDNTRTDIIAHGFDVVTNKISDQLAQQLERQFIRREPWIIEPSVLLYALSLFSAENISEQDKNSFLIILQNYLNPRSGNPTSISKIIELFDYMIVTLERLIKVNKDTSSQINNDLTKKTSSEREVRTFKIKKMFNNFYDSRYSNNMSVDYFSTSKERRASDVGIRQIDAKNFNIRITQEIKKYFDIPSANNDGVPLLPPFFVQINNQPVNLSLNTSTDSYSHISPVRFDLKNYSVITSPLGLSTEDAIRADNASTSQVKSIYQGNIFENMTSLFSEIMQFKLEKNVKLSKRFYPLNNEDGSRSFSITNKQRIIFDLEELWKTYFNCDFLNYNIASTNGQQVSVGPSPPSMASLGNSVANPSIEQPNAEELLKFLTAISIPVIKGTKFDFSERQNIQLFSFLLTDILKNLRNGRYSNSPYYEQKLLNAPYHIKAMAARTTDFLQFLDNYFAYTTFDKAIENKALNYFYFDNIMEIQYLNDFSIDETSEGMINIQNPQWKVLNAEKFLNMRENESILCRLSPYTNPTIGVINDPDIENFIFNKYFILKTPSLNPDTQIQQDYLRIELTNLISLSRELYRSTSTSNTTTNPISNPRGP
jgi:hypothetical protein